MKVRALLVFLKIFSSESTHSRFGWPYKLQVVAGAGTEISIKCEGMSMIDIPSNNGSHGCIPVFCCCFSVSLKSIVLLSDDEKSRL